MNAPNWYNTMDAMTKKYITTILKNHKRMTKQNLVELLMDELGADRSDIQDLLSWWFGENCHNVNTFKNNLL